MTLAASTTSPLTDGPLTLNRVLPLVAPGGVFGIVTFASEVEALTSDAVVITSGDNGGGSSFTVSELVEIFSALEPIEARRLRADVAGGFGADFLNAALSARGARTVDVVRSHGDLTRIRTGRSAFGRRSRVQWMLRATMATCP
jgi:hypothetical protein